MTDSACEQLCPVCGAVPLGARRVGAVHQR
jgi:hypothetical protein